jgi:N-acyl-D-aspartate/D-glutamate deacylase
VHDVVIRGGVIVDGSGTKAREGDVAIDGERIAAVGDVPERGRREIDARGRHVAPGWVDIHTHYDGQATWDPYLTPSIWHGVTTVVMGNCGVGFAPAHPDRRDWLIGLMEGVEDIPGTALAEGIDWQWETFPEYLDALERKPRALDVGTQVPHGAVRAYVMGERGARNEQATAEDIERMREIVREALEAGALGFSTSRTLLHRAIDGEPVPGTFASADELLGIGSALGETGRGIFELASDLAPEGPEMEWMTDFSKRTGRPVTFACLQNDQDPTQWRRLLAEAERAAEAGARVVPQVAGRPTGLLMGLEATTHPFFHNPVYREIAHLPHAERVARMRDPEFRRRVLDAKVDHGNPMVAFVMASFHKLFPLGDPPDYEPTPDASVAAIAEREGKRPEEVAYDLLLRRDGHELLYFPLLGYAEGDLEAVREMLEHPLTLLGLSDGGAHCGLICDASMPTYMLSHWVRGRKRGDRLPLERVVHGQTRRTAEAFDLWDRGLLAPGMQADVNVVDLDALAIDPPEMVHDLPSGAGRLIQRSRGYDCTLAHGQVIVEGGEPTGALPGRLLRGPQQA